MIATRHQMLPNVLVLLAEAYAGADLSDEGSALLARGQTRLDPIGPHMLEAELHRVRGELLRRREHPRRRQGRHLMLMRPGSGSRLRIGCWILQSHPMLEHLPVSSQLLQMQPRLLRPLPDLPLRPLEQLADLSGVETHALGAVCEEVLFHHHAFLSLPG